MKRKLSNEPKQKYVPQENVQNPKTNLFDGVQNLSGDDTFQYCINVSGSNFTIMAKNPKTNCQITLNQNLAVNRNSNC